MDCSKNSNDSDSATTSSEVEARNWSDRVWTGNHSISDAHMSPHPLLFPEVLENVFYFLPDTKDLLNCYKVCGLWRQEIARKKLPILFTTTFPDVAKYLDVSSKRHVRLVCKAWNRSMDNLVESNPAAYCLHQSEKAYELALNNSGKIDRFLQELGSYPSAKPFPDRRLHIGVNEDDDEYFWPRVVNLMKRFGDQLTTFEMEFQGFYEDVIQDSMLRSLPSLPNLRKLGIFLNNWLLCFNAEIQLPPLANLQELEVASCSIGGGCNRLFSTILNTYGPQLKKLGIQDNLLADKWTWKRELPSITELNIGVYDASPGSTETKLGNWSLSGLRFRLRETNVHVLQRLLQGSKETLTDLTIGFLEKMMTGKLDTDGGHILAQELPKLLRLKLVCYTGSYDFLLGLNTVRHLVVSNRAGIPLEINEEDKVKIVGLEACLYESNVWEILPSLETVKILTYEINDNNEVTYVTNYYFRQMYKYLLQKKN